VVMGTLRTVAAHARSAALNGGYAQEAGFAKFGLFLDSGHSHHVPRSEVESPTHLSWLTF